MNRLPTTFLTVALALLPWRVSAQNIANGKDVYGPCAACHGSHGEGGKEGEYPRVATQPPAFTIEQLKLFQARKRYNLPMFPYTEARELSDSDMADVAAYLATMVLPTRAPVFKESDGALDRLLAMEQVLVVPRVRGEIAEGKTLYRRRCAGCHGKTGEGQKRFPRLVGQYPNYLQRQFLAYLKGERPHDEAKAGEGVLAAMNEADLTNILAWLTAIQDGDATEQ